jgi:hypothetical protein
MRTVRLGTKIPARWRAFVCGLAFLASCVLAASASAWVPHLPRLFSTALTPDPDAVLPAPTRYSYREILTTTMLDVDAPLRTRLITADRVHLAFASPLGPAMLELDRTDTGTSIRLVQRNRDAATKARVMPEAGRAALMFTNLGSKDVVFVLDNRAITLPARAGKERPQAPLFNLPPGKYPYALKIEGRPDRDTTIDLVAGDAWDVTVGPDGELWSPLQLY